MEAGLDCLRCCANGMLDFLPADLTRDRRVYDLTPKFGSAKPSVIYFLLPDQTQQQGMFPSAAIHKDEIDEATTKKLRG